MQKRERRRMAALIMFAMNGIRATFLLYNKRGCEILVYNSFIDSYYGLGIY